MDKSRRLAEEKYKELQDLKRLFREEIRYDTALAMFGLFHSEDSDHKPKAINNILKALNVSCSDTIEKDLDGIRGTMYVLKRLIGQETLEMLAEDPSKIELECYKDMEFKILDRIKNCENCFYGNMWPDGTMMDPENYVYCSKNPRWSYGSQMEKVLKCREKAFQLYLPPMPKNILDEKILTNKLADKVLDYLAIQIDDGIRKAVKKSDKRT